MKKNEMYRLNVRTNNQKFIELVAGFRDHGFVSRSEMVVDAVLKNYHLSDEDRIKNQVTEYLEKYARAKLEEYFSSEEFKRWIEILLDERLAMKNEKPFR